MLFRFAGLVCACSDGATFMIFQPFLSPYSNPEAQERESQKGTTVLERLEREREREEAENLPGLKLSKRLNSSHTGKKEEEERNGKGTEKPLIYGFSQPKTQCKVMKKINAFSYPPPNLW